MAKKRVISAVLSLKDKDFGSGVKKASSGTKDFERRVKHAGNQVKQFGKSAVSSFSSVAKGAIGLATAYVGFRKLGGFIGESTEAAKSLIAIETKLESVMKNTKGVTDKQIKSVKNYADELSNASVVGGDVILSGVQQLSSYKLQSESLKKLMPGMDNLLVRQKGLNATTEDAAAIGTMFGKVMSGQTSALSKAGIKITAAQEQVFKFGTESQKASLLAEILEKSVGGVSAAMAKTDQGKIQQMTNAWAVYKEEVGKKILPLQAKFAGWFAKVIPGIQSLVLSAIDKGVAAFDKISGIGVKGFTLVKKMIENNKPAIDFVKSAILSLGGKAVTVKDWAVGAFQNIKDKIIENKPAINGVKSVFSDLGVKALEIKDWLISAFESSKPAIAWIKDEGLPLVVDGIAGVIEKATDVYRYINDNWSAISPIVYGVAGAIAFYKAAVGIASVATKGWAVVTGALTFAQGAFNAVLAISPLGWVAIAIGAVIAVGVLLYQNWDTIKTKATELWDGLTGAWGGIKEGFSNMWIGMKESAASGVNFIIGKLNGLIGGFNSLASFKVPDWVPGVGGKSFGVNIPSIPQFAKGTNYAPGGLAQINERGGEIVDLPNGSRVYPHDKSVQMARSEGNSNTINITINAADKSVTQIVNELIPMLKLRLANL